MALTIFATSKSRSSENANHGDSKPNLLQAIRTARRKILIGSVAGAFGLVFDTNAQQTEKIWRVGFINLASGPPSPSLAIVIRTLQEHGFHEGKNVRYEARFAHGEASRLPGLAKELVDLKVDVIVAIANTGAFAAKSATATIPIVFGGSHGAVDTGLVASLRRPGGNITGTESLAPELDAKRLELLRETLPKATKFAVMSNPLDPGTPLHNKWSGEAAVRLGIRLETFSVQSRDELEGALIGVAKMRPDGILLMTESLIFLLRKQILDFALNNRLPVVSEFSAYTELGGLLSYGPTFQSLVGGAARLVARILKGAKPADLPVEQPMEFELAINLKTAKALGITIPPTVMVRATRVIE